MKKIRLTVTAFFSIIILFTAFIVFFKLQTEAANRSTGDLKVTGGSYGEDYRYENNTLVILSDKPVTISGETKKDRIQVKTGVDANLTLKNLDIRTSGCALDAGDGKVSIKFSGSNYVKSGAKYAGIRVQEGAQVTLSGGKKDTLMVFGGSQAAGIGSEKDMAFGKITVSGGTVTATGGARAAGIGSGYQGTGGDILLKGGCISAYGGAGAADLGSPQEQDGKGTVTLNGNSMLFADDILDEFKKENGIWQSKNTIEVYQKVTLTYPLEIGSGRKLVIPPDGELAIPEGTECVNKGEIYAYGILDVSGTLRNEGEIYDYQGDLEEVSGITGKQASFRDLKDIYLSDGTILFTEDGYEQNGMQFLIVDSSYRGYTIYGDGKEHKASIEVSSGISVSCTLEDVLLSPEGNAYALTVGEGAEAVLTLKGENTFTGGTSPISGSILMQKDAELELKGNGSLTLQSGNGSKMVLSGDGSGDDEEELPEEEADEETEVRITEDEKKMEAFLERDMLERLSDAGESLDINGRMARLRLNGRGIDELLAATAGDIKVRVCPFVLTDKFTEGKLYIGDRPVLDIQVLEVLGEEEEIVDIHFKNGLVTLSIPYQKPSAEDAGNLGLVYVGADNTLDWIKNSYYDGDKKVMISDVTHFSVYGIGYKSPAAKDSEQKPTVSGNTVNKQ